MQAEAGLEALRKCLQAGFEGFSKIREDPNLEKVRANPGFQPLIEEYDEPVISGEAIKCGSWLCRLPSCGPGWLLVV